MVFFMPGIAGDWGSNEICCDMTDVILKRK